MHRAVRRAHWADLGTSNVQLTRYPLSRRIIQRSVRSLSCQNVSFVFPVQSSKGVFFLFVFKFGSAPPLRRRLTVSGSPLSAARCRGVAPERSRAFGLAWASRSVATASARPRRAALCMGVDPSFARVFGLAPVSRTFVRMRISPTSAAANSIVACKTTTASAEVAVSSGVNPFLSCAFGSAPAERRDATALAWPRHAALCKGVRRLPSGAFGLAPASSKAAIAGVWPCQAAL